MEKDNENNQEEQGTGNNDSGVGNEGNENSDNGNSGDGDNFDADAFSSIASQENKPDNNSGDEGSGDKGEDGEGDGDGSGDSGDDGNDGNDDGDDFSWDAYEGDGDEGNDGEGDGEGDNQNNDNENSNDDSNDDSNDNSDDDAGNGDGEGNQSQGSLDDAYLVVADKLGFEAKTVDEFKETLESIQAENDRLRKLELGSVDSKKITTFKNLKKKTDEELVRLELKQQRFSEEEINEAIDVHTDNNTLKFEAKKIRNGLDSAIEREQQSVINSNKDAEAKQQQDRDNAVKELTDHLNGIDTMFDMKMSKDENKLPEIRKNHLEYITSGNFLNEVTDNPANLSEAAWLWKNKDVILKAAKNKGFNKGKQEILDDIGNPDVSDKQRYRDPAGSDEFDVSKFTSNGKKK